MKTFVIHLERAKARRAQVDHILEQTPRPEILPACDGAALPIEQRNGVYPQKRLFKPHYPFALSSGEIGCFESHKAAWRRIIDDGIDGALIVEDDVQIDATQFEPALDLAKRHLNDWGYAQFQVRDIKGGGSELENLDGVSIIRPDVIPLRTSAQLVSRDAAVKLLELCNQIDRPVDAFLQMRWLTDVEVTCMVPSGVSDRTAQTGGSTLSNKRGFLEELKVTLPRLKYRRAINALSQKA